MILRDSDHCVLSRLVGPIGKSQRRLLNALDDHFGELLLTLVHEKESKDNIEWEIDAVLMGVYVVTDCRDFIGAHLIEPPEGV